MTPEQPQPSPEQMRDVFRAMQVRMRNCAFRHLKHINLRASLVLQDMDLWGDLTEPVGAKIDLAILRNPDHPRRVKLPLGPLVAYLTEGEKPARTVVDLPVLLYSELPEVRKTALECLEPMIANGGLPVTPRTRGILAQNRNSLLSDVLREWRPAAVAVNDALYDDVLLALQGAYQSMECDVVIQNSLNFFMQRVMHPSVSSLDSIALEIRDPESEHARIAEIVKSAGSDAKTLTDACAKYYARLGYLPLAPRYSLAEVIGGWLSAHANADVWTEVWGWARGAFGPVPRYHACSVFVQRPDLVPAGKIPELWSEILGVVREPKGKDAAGPGAEAWELRRDLARHFAHHLEANLPESNGASIPCFAWWFSERVAALLPDTPEAARFYLQEWIRPAVRLSDRIWFAASPRAPVSALRGATFTMPAPWAVSLLALMGEQFDRLAPGEQPEPTRTEFHHAVIANLIGCLPFPVQSPADPTFAFECSMEAMALKWGAIQSGEEKEAMPQLIATSRLLGSADGLCTALRKMGESSLVDQIALALALKAKAFTDPAVGVAVWEVLSDETWRQKVLGTVNERVLSQLVEAFAILQVATQGKWFTLFPQYIAELCETTDDDARRRDLFLDVLHASLTSDTVSAVRRLLRGNQKAKFAEAAKEYRARIEGGWEQYPPWVRGRLRGLLASLRVV